MNRTKNEIEPNDNAINKLAGDLFAAFIKKNERFNRLRMDQFVFLANIIKICLEIKIEKVSINDSFFLNYLSTTIHKKNKNKKLTDRKILISLRLQTIARSKLISIEDGHEIKFCSNFYEIKKEKDDLILFINGVKYEI